MRHSRTVLAGWATALALLAPLFLAAPSIGASPRPAIRIDPGLTTLSDGVGDRAPRPDEPMSLMVRLHGPTLWQLVKADRAAAAARGTRPMTVATLRTLKEAMARRQAPTERAIEAGGADVIARYQVVANGFLVHARRAQIAALAGIPEVASITRAPILKPQLEHVVPTIGADRVYQELGIDGTGVTAAVIDTGIDYTHEDFKGAGKDAYAANDENVLESGTFPTVKVVGGFDFAGRRYTSSEECSNPPPMGAECTRVPDPDKDPLDPPGQGHGTHVSGIVAGEGVGSALHPGVAPGARLVALKVFGDPIGVGASTDLTTSAIEWVVDHNLNMPVEGTEPEEKIDVINMSLGSDFGGEQAAEDEVIQAAVEAGVTVVAAAGNAGPTVYSAGNPAGAELALSIASSWAGGQGAQQVKVAWQEVGTAKEENEDAFPGGSDWLPELLDVGVVSADLAYYGLACNDESGNPPPPVQDVNEKIALIERGTCLFYDKIWNAQKLGAVAAIVYNNTAESSFPMGCGAPADCGNGPDIPGVMVTNAVGLRWRARLEAGTAMTATIDPQNIRPVPEITDTISDFSSRGPSRFGAAIKPQITAPGSNVSSAAAGTGTGRVAFDGTSMASPVVAGVAALLWERNRIGQLGLDAAEIAALAMNYADPAITLGDNRTGPRAAVARQGAGRANAYRSAKGNTVVRSAHGIAELSFGNVHVTDDTARETQRLVVRNLLSAAKAYQIESRLLFPTEDANQGVDVLVRPQSLTVAAGMTGTVEVTVALTPSKLRAWELDAQDAISPDAEAAFQRLEVDGFVQLTEVDNAGQPVALGDRVGVPFYVLPRRHACVGREPAGSFLLPEQGATAELTLANPCQSTGTVAVYHLAGTDPPESAASSKAPANLDITAVGLRYGSGDFGQEEQPVLEFAVHTAGARRLPIDAEFHVYLDLDRDGSFDRMLYNAYGYFLSPNLPEGVWITLVAPLIAGTLDPDLASAAPLRFYEPYDVDETTVHLPVSPDDLDPDGDWHLAEQLAQGSAAFDLAVTAADFAEDYPLEDPFFVADRAPDGLAVKNGAVYHFDQSVENCLTVHSPTGADLSAIGASVEIPGRGNAQLRLGSTCPVPSSGGRAVGLLLDYAATTLLPDGYESFTHTNRPDEHQAEVQRGFLGRPSVFLPASLKDHDWRAAEPGMPR